MKLFGWELRKIPKEKPFEITTSIPVVFNANCIWVRVKTKPGYFIHDYYKNEKDYVLIEIQQRGDNGEKETT